MQQRFDGARDVRRAEERLHRRLPEPLEDLAWIAFNYLWSWTPGGEDLFHLIDAHRFELAGHNPVRFLLNLPERDLLRAATDREILELLERVATRMRAELDRPVSRVLPSGPVAFMCAEFAIHSSLPVYSGGLGVLAGDYLKEASDQGLDTVGVGLLYRRGYLHQRMDLSGWQHEFWEVMNTGQMPLVRVRGAHNQPIVVSIPVGDDELVAQVWRVNVGRTVLYLLDAELRENTALERWTTARLYEGSHEIRLAQYGLLGVGGVRALEAMGISPALYHMNEGHPALAALEVASMTARELGGRRPDLAQLVTEGRDRFVFTTHTPVPAGNETYEPSTFFSVLGRTIEQMGFTRDEVAALARVNSSDPHEPLGLSPLAIKVSRSTNAVSERHGEVAREMWRPLFADREPKDVPITHVTNGVHLPSWMAPPMRDLLGRFCGPDWERRSSDPTVWSHLDAIADLDLWNVRNQLRRHLIDMIRSKVSVDRLARGENVELAAAGQRLFDPDVVTVGFARRLATYKRLDLLFYDAERLARIVRDGPGLQLLVAGKAHPLDEQGKAVAKNLFGVIRDYGLSDRVVFLEDYDLRIAPALVSGCDVWLNLPRPPLEASGTSGMKAAMNGVLNLSVLDGWWAEGFNSQNGWGISGSVESDPGAQDYRDADLLYRILEDEVKPLFATRDLSGVPTAWLARVRDSLRTLSPMYSTTRMLADYNSEIYRPR